MAEALKREVYEDIVGGGPQAVPLELCWQTLRLNQFKAKIPRGSGLTKRPSNNTPSRLTPEEPFFILYRMILFAESNLHIASLE